MIGFVCHYELLRSSLVQTDQYRLAACTLHEESPLIHAEDIASAFVVPIENVKA